MDKLITLNDLKFSNTSFWRGFLASAFPTALDEKLDISLVEMIEENKLVDIKWWNEFTKYYEGVMDESDGYIDNPMSFVYDLTSTQKLKIEFHPGDIVYYINDEQIGCTGPHYSIYIFPFESLLKYIETNNEKRLFLLLLPLATVSEQDVDNATQIISDALSQILDVSYCKQFASSIVYGLLKDENFQ